MRCLWVTSVYITWCYWVWCLQDLRTSSVLVLLLKLTRECKVQTAFSCWPETFGLKVQEVLRCSMMLGVLSHSRHPALIHPAGTPSAVLHSIWQAIGCLHVTAWLCSPIFQNVCSNLLPSVLATQKFPGPRFSSLLIDWLFLVISGGGCWHFTFWLWADF